MTSKRDDRSLSPLELVVLARHSVAKPPGPADVVKDVHKLMLPEEPVAGARARVVETLSSLQQRGLLSRPLRTSRKITDAGSHALRGAFAVSRTPTWAQARTAYLPALALELAPGSDEAAKILKDGDRLAAARLRVHFGLSSDGTLNSLCDALILDALGLPASRPLTLTRLRLLMLAKRADVDPKGSTPKDLGLLIRRVVAKELGAPKLDKRSQVAALVRSWAKAQVSHDIGDRGNGGSGHHQQPIIHTPPPPPQPSPSPPPDALLKAVREVIPSVGADGRHGPEKVFVSALWRGLASNRSINDVPLDSFKRWLLSANRSGQVILARADFPSLMNQKLLADSEIEDQGATFHFVIDSRTSGAERRNHAR